MSLEDDISIPPGLATPEARVWIDAQESRILRTLSRLRELRNSLAPVRVLPDDVLTTIFTLLSQSDTWTSYPTDLTPLPQSTAHRIPTWLAVVHTCQRWRRLALSAPTLWTEVDFGIDKSRGFQLSRYFIRLSANATLTLSLLKDRQDLAEITDLTLQELYRVSELQVSLRAPKMAGFVARLNARAPALEALCLRQEYGRRWLKTTDALVVPDLLNGYAPRLRQLTLKLVSVPWTSPLLRDLTALDLSHGNPQVTPTIDQFLSVLEACPQLLSLRINEAGPILPEGVRYPDPTRYVSLPYLRRLVLAGNCADVAHMTAHLILPSTTILRLSADISDETQDFSDLLPRDTSRLGPLGALELAQVTAEDEMLVSVTSTAGSRVDVALDLWFTATDPDARSEDSPAFGKLASALRHTPRVRRLLVAEPGVAKQLEWVRVLGGAKGLEELLVSGKNEGESNAPGNFLWALTCGDEEGMCCPNLKKLFIHALDVADEDVMGALVGMLEIRKRECVPVKTLHLHAPRSYTAKTISMLSEHVVLTLEEGDPNIALQELYTPIGFPQPIDPLH